MNVLSIVEIAFTVIGFIISINVNSKITKFRIDNLEKKVNKHNNLIERMYKVEAEVDTLRHKIE